MFLLISIPKKLCFLEEILILILMFSKCTFELKGIFFSTFIWIIACPKIMVIVCFFNKEQRVGSMRATVRPKATILTNTGRYIYIYLLLPYLDVLP